VVTCRIFYMHALSRGLASKSIPLALPLRYYPNYAPIQYAVHYYPYTQGDSTLPLATEVRLRLDLSLSIE
jgi:hypothetical protein